MKTSLPPRRMASNNATVNPAPGVLLKYQVTSFQFRIQPARKPRRDDQSLVRASVSAWRMAVGVHFFCPCR